MRLRPKGTAVVVDNGKSMSDDEMVSALKSITPLSMRALLQAIEVFRQEHALSAARGATANNPLSMASDNGAYEALSGLIEYLDAGRDIRD